MESDFAKACTELVWRDPPLDECFPAKQPLLAHYTTVATLEKIVSRDELWMSHPYNMNDHEEMQWGLTEGARMFEASEALKKACGTEQRFQAVLNDFGSRYVTFDAIHAASVYIACFCEHEARDGDGKLSMWRGYGANGGGVALIFDSSKLAPMEAIKNSPFVLHPVTYGSKEDRRQWLRKLIGDIADLITATNPGDKDLWRVSANFFERLKAFAVFTKHSGFKEESEWRLAYLGDRDTDKRFQHLMTYAITDRGVFPKMKLKMAAGAGFGDPEISLSSITKSILLGPAFAAPLSMLAVQRMLTEASKEELARHVSISGIPFRA